MSETYEVYAEMVETLRQAQGAVREELEALARAPSSESNDLVQLREAITSFDDQAHALVLMLSNSSVPDELLQMAEDLAHFFGEARERIAVIFEAGQG